MASGGHLLLQQKPALVGRIKTLINADLKEVCKAYGQPVSGNKAQLQTRCQEALDNIVNRGDHVGFSDFKYRVENHGQTPPRNPFLPASSAASQHMAPGGYPKQMPAQNKLPHGGKFFKASPFYDVLETVLPMQDLPGIYELPPSLLKNPYDTDAVGPEMPQNRHTVRAEVKLTQEHCDKLRSSDSYRLMIYCSQTSITSISHWQFLDVAFPNQIEVRVNGEEVKANFKGLKNKAGSTKPADITPFMRKQPGYANQLSVTYALTSKKYAYMIYLVRQAPVDDLVSRIKNQIITKQKVIDEMNRVNADPDIAATSTVMSLKDPISTTRINLPVRSGVCTHNQCFDGRFYLELQEQAPTWVCPICNKSVAFQSLSVDKYVEDILTNTSKSIEKVTIEPTGEWSVVKDDESDAKPNGREARAHYDDDFDDDEIVEIDGPGSNRVNNLKAEAAASASPMFAQPLTPSFMNQTPPLSSREPSIAQSTSSAQRPLKRPANAVIDLTLSDDDEPPRPAKRAANSYSQGTSTSYNTPASLPDPRYNSHANESIGYRPPSNSGGTAYLNQNGYTNQLSSGPSNNGNAHSRPLPAGQTNGVQPFSIRPPQSPTSMRLPPMNVYPPNGESMGWRGDYGSYSNSPG